MGLVAGGANIGTGGNVSSRSDLLVRTLTTTGIFCWMAFLYGKRALQQKSEVESLNRTLEKYRSPLTPMDTLRSCCTACMVGNAV